MARTPVAHSKPFLEQWQGRSWVHRIPLPESWLQFFSSSRKDFSPYELFHFWVMEQLGGLPAEHSFRVEASWICQEDYDLLEGEVALWAKKCHYLTGQELHVELESFTQEVGPAEFVSGMRPDWAQKGFIYIEQDPFLLSAEAHTDSDASDSERQ